MKCKRVELIADVEKYEIGRGMEDGFEPWFDVVTKAWIVTDFLVKVEREDGTIVCPYVMGKRGRIFIGENDYIIKEDDGTKHVCGENKIWKRYQKLESEA